MKRFALLAFATLLVVSCSDDRSLTQPGPAVTPSFDVVEGEDPNADRIAVLISSIEKPGGQLNSTEKRWENIQRQWALGEVDAAIEQMYALADKAVDFYSKDNLLSPPVGEDVPETTGEAVAELVMRLFVYVDFHSLDAVARYTPFYLAVGQVYPDFFTTASDFPDSGFDVVLPDDLEPTVIITEHAWAALEIPAGAVEEPTFISIELQDTETCDVDSGLQEANGCWDINRIPEGDFLEPIHVEICVDPDPVEPSTLWDYLLIHKEDEVTGEISALPWDDLRHIDPECPGFTVGGGEPLLAAADSDPGFWKSLGNSVTQLLLPDPLVAHPPIGSPPRGIGGLESSFSKHFGAVPATVSVGLLSWWSADGHYFDMYGGNHGDPVGSVPFVSGVSDEAFDLSGSDNEVLIQPLSEEIRTLQELTVATWVYLNPTSPADQIQRFVTVGGGPDMAVLRQEGGGNRMLHFYMHFEDTPDPNNLEAIRVDNAFQTGCFHFFAGTYGLDDYMRAYLDGVEVGSRYVPAAEVIYGSDYAKLGASGGAGVPGEEMDGYLDEVMIFDRALDPSEIQALYEAGGGNICAPASYSEVTVDPTYVGPDPTVVPTLADAMVVVQPGGTVWMADGTHNAENVLVSKPVTIDEVPGYTAVIQNDVEPRAIRIGDYGSGVVTIQNLDFVNNVEGDLVENRSVSIHAVQGWDQVVIHHNTFFSPYENASTLLQIDETHVAGASATIQENTFSGGRWAMYSVGTSGSSDPFVTVDNNTFTGHTNGAIQFREEAHGIASNNNLTNCGVLSCIYISGGSQVAVTGNTISDHTAHPGGDPTYYHTGIYSSSPIGPISDNTFDGCGWGSCIEVNGAYGADTDIHHNTITAYGADQTEVGILAYGGDHADIGDADPPTVRITDNVLVGVGSMSSDPEDPDNPFYHGGILIRNAYATGISRNQITNAAAGIYMFQNGFVYAGSDNEFDQTIASIRGGANADIAMTGNDFTTTTWSIMDNDASLTADLDCNWWGSADGPLSNSFPPTSNPIVYWPWMNDAVADGGTCYAPATIGGHLLLDGSPINGATITATGPQNLTATTDGDGDYLFYNVLPGTYTVSITPSTGEYPFTSQVVPLAPAESATVDFSGAYYPSVPTSGIGSATSWVVSQPSIGVTLCNGEGSTPCATNETFTLEARATGPSSTFLEPDWDEVHFYFREATAGAVYWYAGTELGAGSSDNGVTREYWWTATLDLDGLEIPAGVIEVIAIGVHTDPIDPVTYFTVPVNANITVVDGTIGGDD